MAVELCACVVHRPRFQTGFRKRRRQRVSILHHVTGTRRRRVVSTKHAVDDRDTVRQWTTSEEHEPSGEERPQQQMTER